MGGTNTRPSVFDGFISDAEFTQIMTNHFRLNFNLVESLAIVNANNAAGHLWNDNHVSQMCFDDVRFLVDWAFLFLLTKLFDQSHGLTLEATANFPSDTAREQFHELFIVHVQELIQVHTSIGELTEGPLLLEFCGSLKDVIYSLLQKIL